MKKTDSQLPSVLISVLNWNAAEKTIRCLESLQQCKYPRKEILVVDNHSRDQSVAQIKRAFPAVTVITTPSNLGYAGGHAYAAAHAKSTGADLLWILNNDLVVFEDTLDELVQVYHAREAESLLGSVSFSELTTTPVMPVWGLDEQDEVRFDTTVDLTPYYTREGACRHNTPIKVANLYGNSMLVPLSVIDKYGFIDCSFFMYAEENDYCFRLRAKGVALYLVPASRVLHECGGTANKHSAIRAAMRYYITRNTLVFYKRHRRDVYKSRFNYLFMYYMLFPVRRFILRKKGEPFDRYDFYGFIDAALGRMGKRIKPEKYIS